MSPQRLATPLAACAVIAGIALLLPAAPCLAQAVGKKIPEKPAPTHNNVSYGPHKRNVLDVWQAKADQPTPLVLFIHGGGFGAGSKDQISPAVLKELLDAGISVASIEYRLIGDASLPAAHQDVARALQFLRSKAKDWNIDKTRVGAFGGSAGAQLCMYLAFHDDLADPKNDDPMARESTRLTCVAPSAGQVTMDFDWWIKHVPGYDKPLRDPLEPFGVKTKEEALKINEKIAALSLISKDDPPVFMSYAMAPGQAYPDDAKTARNWKIHHIVHGVELKKLCDKLGVECHLHYPGAKSDYKSASQFLKAKLVGSGDKQLVALFDGKTLDGWTVRGGKATYKVEDGAIVGTTVEGSPNTFLCTKKEYGDFELTFEVKCDPKLNSGVQVRSHAYAKDTPQPSNPKRIRPAGDVYGPQVEIAADGNAGRIWDEARHAKWHDPDPSEKVRKAYKPDAWNRFRIVAEGDRIRTWVNGVPVADIRVEEKEYASGFIGLQVHSIKPGTGPYQVRWRNIRIRELKPEEKID